MFHINLLYVLYYNPCYLFMSLNLTQFGILQNNFSFFYLCYVRNSTSKAFESIIAPKRTEQTTNIVKRTFIILSICVCVYVYMFKCFRHVFMRRLKCRLRFSLQIQKYISSAHTHNLKWMCYLYPSPRDEGYVQFVKSLVKPERKLQEPHKIYKVLASFTSGMHLRKSVCSSAHMSVCPIV